MKKIGIDARMLGPKQTGIGNYIQELINRVPALDPQNHYYIFLRPPYFTEWVSKSKNVTKVFAPEKWYSYKEQLVFPLRLFAYNLDLVHFPHFNVPLLYPKKHITTIHDITPKFFHGHKMTSKWRRKMFDLVFDNAITQSEEVITVSEFTRQDILEQYPELKTPLSVVYNGFHPRFNSTVSYDTIKEIKAKYSITKPFILFIGVWRNHKNIAGLVRAFSILKKQGHDIQLVLGGEELDTYTEPREIWEAEGIGGDIILPGFIPDEDMAALYAAAELYVIPSFYEGFGINGLEAFASGTPVVASNTTALPEIYGDTIRYFSPGNPKEMAETIVSVLDNPDLQDEIISKGKKLLETYSWKKTAQETFSIYKKHL